MWGQAGSAEMALDLTTAIVSDLAGRVLASILVSIAMCAGGTVALLAWSRRPTIPVAATRRTLSGDSSTVARRKPSFDDQRGSLPSGADHRATTLYSAGPEGPDHDAVMRIGGEAPGRRAHSQERCQHHGWLRVTRIVIGDQRYPVRQAPRAPRACPVRALPSRCSHDDASRHLARGHHSPQCDQQLSRQGHDQGLARAAPSICRARPVPLRQRTLLLMKQEAPGQLDHPAPHAGVARLGDPFLAPPAATLVG